MTEAVLSDEELSPATDPMRGVYNARRAAALSGVPSRTLAHWASKGYYLPSISPEPRTRLWSWYDLVALRTIDWMRHPKVKQDYPRVSFEKIRAALDDLEQRGLSRVDLRDLVAVSSQGQLYWDAGADLIQANLTGQAAMREMLPVVRPYNDGPDLLQPRPLLRIIPGKLHGEPHVADTRISSLTIFALRSEGYSLPQIGEMYPEATPDALGEAIDLEESLIPTAA